MNFIPERLKSVRENLGITKAEAARRLNMSAMGYGRYENGDRTPSFQTISFMAQKLGTSVEYLCGETDTTKALDLIITSETPELYYIVDTLQNESSENLRRVLEYVKELQKSE